MCRGGGRLCFPDGRSLSLLATDLEQRQALILVDVDAWTQDAARWRRELAACNQARLAGWRVIRVPSAWVASREGQELIDKVARI